MAGENGPNRTKVRSELLSGISQKAHVPHMFILDRDERSDEELRKLRQVGKHVHVLERRELENYLFSPPAILAALRKRSGTARHRGKLNSTSEDEITAILRSACYIPIR